MAYYTPCETKASTNRENIYSRIVYHATTVKRPIDVALAVAKTRGLNQTAFAEKVGASPSDITNWKNRGMPPGMHQRVALALSFSVDELLGLERSGQLATAEPSLSLIDRIARLGRADLMLASDLLNRMAQYPDMHGDLLPRLESLLAPPVAARSALRLASQLPPDDGPLKSQDTDAEVAASRTKGRDQNDRHKN